MTAPNPSRSYPSSRALFDHAKKIIPGGIHVSGRPLTTIDGSPMYLHEGAGCRVRDVDGNVYLDYLMAFGPFLLGYARAEVDRAAHLQGANGRLLSMNHPMHVRFVEALLERFPGNDMGIFFRTGSEATTAALRMARRATGRRRVVRCGYHGWHDWCLPLEDFVPEGLSDQVLELPANDPDALTVLFEKYPGEIAAVILAPEMILPFEPARFHSMAAATKTAGAVFVMDEVKTGLRISPGTVSGRVGLEPDVMTLSKALGNGWAVAAVLGKRAVLEAGNDMHYSGTFHGDTAAMAAALETIRVADAEGAADHAWAMGARLIDGLNAICATHGMAATAFGEPLPPMPFLRFEIEDGASRARVARAFYEGCLAAGVLFHPRHMWFTSLAHRPEDIDRTLEVADAAMRDARTVL